MTIGNADFDESRKYRKIPNVGPGLIEVFKHFLGGLYSGGLIFGGAYIRDFTVSKNVLISFNHITIDIYTCFRKI